MLRLSPPHQPLPDNLWHTLLITALASAWIWLGWVQGLEAFRTGEPVGSGELLLQNATGVHPLYLALESVTNPHTPWLWNRALSCLGWALTLGLAGRILTRISGFLSCLPSVLLLAGLPGLSLRMCAGASGSLAAWLFLLAFSAVLLEDLGPAWRRGGIYAGLAVWLDPAWSLPALGLFAGLWEIRRDRLPKAAIGCGAALGLCLLGMLLLEPSGLSLYRPTFGEPVWPKALAEWLTLYPLLLAAGIWMLLYGALRRGLLWWSLVLALPAALTSQAWHPFLLLFLFGLARLPELLGIRHPRVYQSVLLCQLLLALPSLL